MQKRSVLFFSLLFLCLFSIGPAGSAQAQQSTDEGARKLVHKVPPKYPDLARHMNLAGTVKVVAVVAADGNVRTVEPVGGHPLLVQAAESAVSQWKYVSGSESRETIEVKFTP